MSKVVDQRVVEMQFDNRHFEQNVQTTMSTLDKLKQKLNLGGAAKGLDEVNSAAKRIDMSGLGRGVEAVSAKFSALQVMGVTTLANITNSAVNAGKRIASALTIEPVRTGFSEYELKMGSIQTIMAGTGESLETVNQYLNELNEYSDQTIYSFSDMTQNIAKFTNAGVKLEDAVMAIKGISNEAAISGANANEASRAMYNFSQALSAGFVKLIDWKSIELANMATVDFKQNLIDTAVEVGTLTKRADGLYDVVEIVSNAAASVLGPSKNFNDSLANQWMTTEVLTKTLRKYADETTDIGKKATKAATEVKTYTQMMDALKESAQSGWAQTWEIIFGDFNQGKTLWTNINNVVSKVLDTMSDARNNMLRGAMTSGWDDLSDKIKKAGFTLEDYEDSLKRVLKKSGVSVDSLIKKYGSLWDAVKKGGIQFRFIKDALKDLLGVGDEAVESTEKMTMSVEELEKVVKRVMNGEFGDGAERMKALAEAGYDYATVQNKINEILGSSVRHTSELTDSQKEQIASLSKLSDEQLKNKGYTEEQIEALRDLEKMAGLTGESFDELIKKMEKPSGRELLIDSFKNMWTELSKIFKLIGEAWTNVFGEKTDEDRAEDLYELIEAFHKLTESMTLSEDAADNFRRILEGIFSALDLSWSLASASFMGGLKILNEVLKIFGTDLIEVLANVADLITKFNDWVEIETIFGSSTKWNDIARILVAVYEGIRDCAKAFFELEKLQPIIERIKNLFKDLFGVFDDNPLKAFTPDNIVKAITDFFDKIEAWIRDGNTAADLSTYIIEGIANGLKTGIGKLGEILSKVCTTVYESIADFFGADTEFRDLGSNVISGLIQGMSDGIQGLINIATQVFKAIYDTIANLFQVHSPSRVMIALGGFIIAGLISGLLSKNGELESVVGGLGSILLEGFKNILSMVVNGIKEIDLGEIVAVGLSGGLIYAIKKLSDALALFGNPLKQLGGMFKAIKNIFETLDDAAKEWAKAQKYNAIGKMVLNMAIGLGILVGAVIALCWAIKKLEIDWKVALGAIGIIAALAGILAILAAACTKLNDTFKANKKGLEFGLKTASIIGIALSLALMAAAFKMLAGIDAGGIAQTAGLFVIMIGGLSGLMIAISQITKKLPKEANIKGIGKIFTKLAWSLLIMIGVIKLASMLTPGEIVKGTIVIGLIGGFYWATLKLLSSVDGATAQHANNFGKLATKLSFALLLMIGVIKLASMLSVGEIAKGSAVIIAIGVMFGVFIKFAQTVNKDAQDISKVGLSLLQMSAGLLIAVLAVKMVAGMSVEDILKGVGVIYALGGLFMALTWVSKFAGPNATKAGAMLIEAAAAMLIMTAVLIILKDLDPEGIGKALGIITAFTILFGGLIAVTKFAGSADNIKGTLITLTVAIGILAAALVALSLLDSKKVAIASGALAGVMGMFVLLIKVTSFVNTGKKTWSRAMLTVGIIAIVVGMLTGLIVKIATLEPDRALASAGALGILLLSLSGALMIISNSKSLSRKNMGNMLITLGVLTVIISALAVSIAILRNVDPLTAIGAATGLGILLNSLASAFLIITKSKSLTKKNMDNMLGTIGMLALVTIALSVAILILKNVDPLTAVGAAVGLGILLNALSASLVVLSNSKSISKSKLPSLLITLMMLTLVTGALGGVISQLKDCDPLTSIGNAIALSLLLGMLSAAFDTLAKSKSITKAKLPGMIATLGMLTIVTGMLAIIIKKLSDCDPMTSIGNAIALSLLVGMLTLLTIPLSSIGKTAGSAVKGALALTSMVVPLSAFAFAISKLPEISDAQIHSITVLSQVMVAMTLLMIPLVILGNFIVSAALGIAGLTAMVVPLAAFALAISKLPDVSSAEASILLLVKVMTAMTLLMIPLTIIGFLAIPAALGIAALTAMVIPLKTFANAINELPDISSSLLKVNVLMMVMERMTDMLAKISEYGFDAIIGVAAINGMVNVVTAFGGLATAVGFLMEKFPSLEEFLYKGLSVLEAIGDGLGRVLGSFIASFGEEVSSSLPTIGTNLTAFAEGASGFMEKIKMADESVITGAKNLAKAILIFIGADFLNGMLSLMSFGDTGLADFASELSGFMDAIGPFLDKVSQVDPAVIESIKLLSQAMLALTAADLISCLSSFLGAKLDLADFGTQMKSYGEGVAAFNDAIKDADINEETVTAAANAGKIMAELQKSIAPMGGVIQYFTGEKNLETFGSQLKAYGEALVSFSKTVSEEGAINEGAIEAAKNAGTLMTELQSAIEPTEGVLQWLAGTTSLETFGSQLKAYGDAVVSFSKSVSEEGAINETAIAAAANAGKIMAEVQKGIPENKWLDGKMSIAKFGEKIAKFGEHIKTYSGHVSEISVDKIKASTDAAKSLVSIAKSAAGIDTEKVGNFSAVETIGTAMGSYVASVAEMDPGIVSSSISSANRLRNFIVSLVDLDSSGVSNFKIASIGTQMKNYAASVAEMDPAIVSSSISSANRLKNFIASLVDLDSSGISNFRVSNIGDSIKGYAISVAGIDPAAVSSSISAANRLRNFISSLAGLDASGVDSFATAVNQLGQVSLTNFIKAFSGSGEKLTNIGSGLINSLISGIKSKQGSVKTTAASIMSGALKEVKNENKSFKTAGAALITNLANGIKSKKSAATTAVSSVVSSAADEVDNAYSDFYSAGSDLVDGFVAGITANSFKAAAQAAAMASAAAKAAKDALDINSPSKVFRAIGMSIPEGFAMGIEKLGYAVKASTVGMTDSALDGVKGAISRISDVVNSDIDSQPVIRPVLDLSDIQSGAGAINGLFGMTPSVGVMSNVRAINSMMSKNQNGGSAEIVSAIDKLRGDLGNIGGDTYQINGVTYGADSEVSAAIQTLVRAIKVEGRI